MQTPIKPSISNRNPKRKKYRVMDTLSWCQNNLTKLWIVNAVLIIVFAKGTTSMAPICCFPEVYEAQVFGLQGLVDTGLPDGRLGYGFGILNATVTTAYDSVNERTYTHTGYWIWMSVYPALLYINETDIVDYKNKYWDTGPAALLLPNVQYRVYYDGTCDEMEAGYQLYPECIPGNATLMSIGNIGDGTQVKTYLFRDRIYLDPYEVTIAVVHSADNHSECVPVRFSESQAYVFQDDHNVDITFGDVVDVTPGIHNTSIFIPPKNCKNETMNANDLPRRGTFAFSLKDLRKSRSIAKLLKNIPNKRSQQDPTV